MFTVSTEPYVEGARARGVAHTGSGWRALPKSLGPALVQATILLGFAIQVETGLPFSASAPSRPRPRWA